MDNFPRELCCIVSKICQDKEIFVDTNTPLIGQNGILSSMELVELCLYLEDKATELGFDFDWTSESAMSQSQSMFRTVSTLADAFAKQMVNQK